jgi:hypothetical protein
VRGYEHMSIEDFAKMKCIYPENIWLDLSEDKKNKIMQSNLKFGNVFVFKDNIKNLIKLDDYLKED